jgi:HlyD family type I secretion membrane fusion protein
MNSSPNQELLRPIQKDEFLPPVSLWMRLGGLTLVGAFVGVFAVASLVKYNVVVKANAMIRPAGDLRIVQSSVEGAVTRIEVKENQTIREGEILVVLDDGKLQTQKSQLQGTIEQTQTQLTQIDAQLAALDRQIVAETNLMERAIASAQDNLTSYKRTFRDRQLTLIADLQEAETEVSLAQEELAKYQQATEAGVLAPVLLLQKQQAVAAAAAKLKRVQTALNPTNAEVGVAQQRIAQEQARGESTRASLLKERETLMQKRVESQNQLSQNQKQLRQLEIDLNKSIVRAPTAGTILQLNLRNPGQTVRPGDAIAQMTPSNAPLVLKSQISPGDIGKIKVGQPVQMRVSAYPYPDYGTLPGVVSAIASDTAPNTAPNDSQNAAAYYEVTIQPQVAYLKNDPQNLIQPGMEGAIDIVVQEETVLTFVLRKARLLSNL